MNTLPQSCTIPKLPTLQYAWQARRDSNPQHADLESAALPLELLAFIALFYFFASQTRTQLFILFLYAYNSFGIVHKTFVIAMSQSSFFSKLFACSCASCTFHTLNEKLFCFLPYQSNERTIHETIFLIKLMEPATGIEPVTSPLPRKCSTN